MKIKLFDVKGYDLKDEDFGKRSPASFKLDLRNACKGEAQWLYFRSIDSSYVENLGQLVFGTPKWKGLFEMRYKENGNKADIEVFLDHRYKMFKDQFPQIVRLIKEGLEALQEEGIIEGFEPGIDSIMQVEKSQIKERAEALVESYEFFGDFKAGQFLDEVDDSYYYFLTEEYTDEIGGQIYEKLKDEYLSAVEKALKSKAKKTVEMWLDDYETVAYALGTSFVHTPYTYTPVYQVLSEEKIDETGVKELLEEAGIPPHAFGITANYDNWGNYWWLVLNKDNYKEKIDEDIDVAVAVLSGGYEVISDLDMDNRSRMKP